MSLQVENERESLVVWSSLECDPGLSEMVCLSSMRKLRSNGYLSFEDTVSPHDTSEYLCKWTVTDRGSHMLMETSCFISYSTKDEEFANRLHADLQDSGVRCWFASHDVKAGKKLHEQIDEAIRLYDRLLLILSEHSMNSEWVKTEVAHARQKEQSERRQVLFPISLAPFEKIQSWKCFDADTGKDSAREIREYFIPDFSNWRDRNSYRKVFQRLVRDLRGGVPKPIHNLSREEFEDFKRRAIDPVPMGPVLRPNMNRGLADDALRSLLAERIAKGNPVYLLLSEYERRLDERNIKPHTSS
jgi:hypothetical protein